MKTLTERPRMTALTAAGLAFTMAISLAGYLYLLVFWASALLKAKAGKKEAKKSKAGVRKPAKK